jgi:predicted Zn-dependent protease
MDFDKMLFNVHAETNNGRQYVSNSEIGNFGQAQGKQRIARRHTQCMPHKKSRRLTQRSHKRAISGWKQLTPSLFNALLNNENFS